MQKTLLQAAAIVSIAFLAGIFFVISLFRASWEKSQSDMSGGMK